MTKEYGNYSTTLFNDKGLIKKAFNNQLGMNSVQVEVDHKLFAKEPNRFEKWWVNFWFFSNPVDQCAFRRRRILAYSLQPIVVIPYFLIKTLWRIFVALLMLIWVKKNIGWSAIIHPWEKDNDDLWLDAGEYKLYRYSLAFFLRPPIILGMIWLAPIIFSHEAGEIFKDFWGLAWLVIKWCILILACLTVLLLIIGLFNSKSEKKQNRKMLLFKQRLLKTALLLKHGKTLTDDTLIPLVCQNPSGTSIESLPPEFRTVTLRKQAIMAKACLPFARN